MIFACHCLQLYEYIKSRCSKNILYFYYVLVSYCYVNVELIIEMGVLELEFVFFKVELALE